MFRWKCSSRLQMWMFDRVYDLYFMAGQCNTPDNNTHTSAGFCCVFFFVCSRVCLSCLPESLIDFCFVCSNTWWSSSSFNTPSLCLFFLLSISHPFLCLHPFLPPPPPDPRLCPLRGFVLLPQCQGPGDEVTLHRRAAGLTEPRPSPHRRLAGQRVSHPPPPALHM